MPRSRPGTRIRGGWPPPRTRVPRRGSSRPPDSSRWQRRGRACRPRRRGGRGEHRDQARSKRPPCRCRVPRACASLGSRFRPGLPPGPWRTCAARLPIARDGGTGPYCGMTPGLVLALLALLLALPSPASAALSFCGPADRSCARVTVPLDRSGKVPGQIGLEVEEGFAKTPIRPPLFVFAGGPGQGATYAFDNVTLAQILGPERRNRNVVVFDQRGTGDSGPLDCPEAQRQRSGDPAADAATCANRLGPRRAFYTTRDSVADIEAVRQRMGTPKIALYGTSYGTKVALAYALAYPGHVDRIVLDSVVPLDGPDSLNRQTIGAIPRVLRSRCGHSCR